MGGGVPLKGRSFLLYNILKLKGLRKDNIDQMCKKSHIFAVDSVIFIKPIADTYLVEIFWRKTFLDLSYKKVKFLEMTFVLHQSFWNSKPLPFP